MGKITFLITGLLILLTTCTRYTFDKTCAFHPPFTVHADEMHGMIPYGGEASYIQDHDTLWQWYNTTARKMTWLRYSCDGGYTWSQAAVTNLSPWFPDVKKYKDEYYAMTCDAEEKNIYLYVSEDRLHWSALNNGKPIVTATDTPTDYRYRLFNPGFDIQHDTIYALIEGAGKQDNHSGYYATNAFMGFFQRPLSTPAGSLPSTPCLKGGNPQVWFNKENHRLLVVYGFYEGVFPNYASNWHIQFAEASLRAPQDSTSWRVVASINTLGNAADPSIAFLSARDSAILYYEYNQGEAGKQAYIPHAGSIDQLDQLVR